MIAWLLVAFVSGAAVAMGLLVLAVQYWRGASWWWLVVVFIACAAITVGVIRLAARYL